MKIVQYCQHVLGIGHLFRSLEICRVLCGHDVIMVTGGPQVHSDLPDHVRQVRLPDLQMNREFKGLYSSQKNTTLDQIKKQRQKRLFDLFKKEEPDVFLVELYPFGRKAFRFELDPVLQAIGAKRLPACRVVCSVRDILVEKEDSAKHEARAVKTLNRYFDAVLVHADPALAQLDETFDQFDEIEIPVVYTGYITPRPKPDAGQKIRKQLQIGADEFLIIASAGGGNVGGPLLEAVVRAFDQLNASKPCRLKVFSGPFLEQGDLDRLKRMAGKNVQIERFTPDFLSYLAAADLSVSMGGYNTTMNILASGVPALVWPFPQNREQGLRAGRLAEAGVLQVIEGQDPDPDRLAALMERMLASPRPRSAKIDLDGAVNTAAWLTKWFKERWV